MASLIGLHMRFNGIKQIPSRVVFSMNGNGLGGDETHPDTLTIFRDTTVFPDGEAPPDMFSYGGEDWPGYGEYWYSGRPEGNLKAKWDANPADYYAILNEQGGGEGPDSDIEANYRRVVEVSRAISQAANADGKKCCILNLAGGSPGNFEIWKNIVAPYIVEAWEGGGNVYGRHVYADAFVTSDGQTVFSGQPQRVIDELDYLKNIGYGGGVVLTECGLFGGYDVADYPYFEQQITAWEQALRPYADMLIGLCWWETGSDAEFNADYTDHLKQLLPYIEAGDLPKWAPPTPPENGGNMPTYKNLGGRVFQEKLKGATHARLAFYKDEALGNGEIKRTWIANSDLFEYPEGANAIGAVQYEEEEEEPGNPNPPIAQIAQGAIGHDVSAWQGSFDWAGAVANGVEYGIIRLADGMTANTSTHDEYGIDRQFWLNAEKLLDAGIPWSIYHFLRPGSIQAQANKVLGVLSELLAMDWYPRTGRFDNDTLLPPIFIDVEDSALTNQHVKDFYDLLATEHPTGIYTGKGVWEQITAGAPIWWAGVPLWIAAYGANDGTIPNWPDGPFMPNGWESAVLWQYTSVPLDTNSAGPYPPNTVGKPSYSTAFMRAEPNIWRVIRRSDGSGEDVWELPLSDTTDVRVKNTSQGEWYGYLSDGVYRTLDTSPANDSQGNERYYTLSQNGQLGGQIAPATAVLGVTYTFYNDVQFYSKDVGASCPPLSENSEANVPSTFTLLEVIDNYTFPTTGFVVDRLYITDQTGERQLYAEHQGRIIGWVGGGASQDNNNWGGELNELYFDREIPPNPPTSYCVQ